MGRPNYFQHLSKILPAASRSLRKNHTYSIFYRPSVKRLNFHQVSHKYDSAHSPTPY